MKKSLLLIIFILACWASKAQMFNIKDTSTVAESCKGARDGRATIIMEFNANSLDTITYIKVNPFDNPVIQIVKHFIPAGRQLDTIVLNNLFGNLSTVSISSTLKNGTQKNTSTNLVIAGGYDVQEPAVGVGALNQNITVCEGAQLRLFAQSEAGSSYKWTGPNTFTSTSQNPVINNAQAINMGTYKVAATHLGNQGKTCTSDTMTITPTITDVPNPDFTIPIGICQTVQQLTLTVDTPTSGVDSYLWRAPGSSQPTNNTQGPFNVTYNTVTPSGSPNNITLVVTKSGCRDSVVKQIQIKAAPTARLSASAAKICNGATGTLTVTFTPSTVGAGPFYFSYDANGTTVSDSSNKATKNITISIASKTTYKLLSVNNFGCGGTVDATPLDIDINPPLVATMDTIPASMCDNALPITLTGSPVAPPGTSSFSGPGVSGSSASGFVFTPANSGAPGVKTILYTYTDVNGCSATASRSTTILGKPVVTIGNIPNQCTNITSVTLTGTGTPTGGTGVFSGPGVTGNILNPSTLGASVNNKVTYTYTSPNGCVNTATSNSFTVTQAPELGIISSATICKGKTFTFIMALNKGTPPYNYSYTDGTTTFSGTRPNNNPFPITQTPLVTTTYTLLSVSNASCSSGTLLTPITATVRDLPVITFNPITSPVCPSAPLIDLVATPAGGTFSTTPSAAITGTKFDPSKAGFTGTTVTRTVTYSYTDPATTCANTATQPVTIVPAPTATFTVNPNPVCPSTNVAITYTGNGTAAGVYNWNFDGSTATGQGPHTAQWATPNTTKKIKLTLNEYACSAADSQTVTIKAAPTASVTATAGVCQGTNAIVTFTFTGTGPWDLVYNDGTADITRNGIATSPFILAVPMTIIGTRTFTIKSIKDAGGCNGSFINSQATVNVVAKPNSSFTPSLSSICSGGSSTFQYAPVSATATYNWKFAGGSIATTTGAGPHNVTWTTGSTAISNVVTLIINESSGCIDSSKRTIVVIPLPTATISNDSAVCAGTSGRVKVTFTGTAPFSATLKDQNGNTFPVGPTNSNVFYASVGAAITSNLDITLVANSVKDNNCTGTGSANTVKITVRPLPTATIAVVGSSQACLTDSVTLRITFTGTAPFTYTYQNTLGVSVTATTSANPLTFKVQPGGTTTYTVSSVKDQFCSNTGAGSASVTTIPYPTATFTANNIACMGDIVDVVHTGTASASAIYNWDFAGGTVISGSGKGPYKIGFSSATNKIIKLTISEPGFGCVTPEFSRNVDVKVLPSATLSGNQTVCQGNNAILQLTFPTGTAPFTVVYTDGTSNFTATGLTNPGTILVPMLANKTFTLVNVTDVFGCKGTSVSGSAVIKVVTKPTSDFSLATGVCLNNQTKITYSGTTSPTATYIWDFGGGVPPTATGTADHFVSWASLGAKTVSLIVNESGACSDTTTKSILVGNPPTAVISNDTTVCLGSLGAVKLTFTGAAPYKATLRNVETGALIPVTTNSLVTYVPVTVTDSTTFDIVNGSVSDGNCNGVGSGTVKIHVNPVPTARISGTSTLCIGDSATLKLDFTGVAPFNYTYQRSTGGTVSGTTNNNSISIKVGPLLTTTYKLTVASDKFCAATIQDSAVVSIVQKPVLNFTISAGCIDTPLDVNFTGTASALANYTWSFDPDGSPAGAAGIGPHQVTYNTTGTKNIKLVLQDQACAVDSLTKSIVVNPLPTVTLSGNSSICQGDSTALTFTFTGTAPWAFTYNNGAGNVNATASVSPFIIKVAPNTTTNYKLVSVQDANLCANTTGFGTDVAIKVSIKPTSDFVIDSLKMCQNDSVLVTYSGLVSATATYDWDFNGGVTRSLGNESYKVFWPTGGVKTVSLSVDEAAGCLSDTTLHSITVNVLPSVNIGIDTITICAGDAATIPFTLVTGTVPYNVTLVDTEGGLYTYNFKGVFSPQPIIFNDSTILQIQANSVKDANGCIGSGTGKITINAKPLATAEISKNTQICAGQSTKLKIHFTGIAPYNYTYNNGTVDISGTSPADSVEITVNPATTTIYKMVSVSDALCAGVVSDSVAVVTVITLPIASIDLPPAACENIDVDVKFNGTSTAAATYNWDFGTGVSTPAGNGLAQYQVQWASSGMKYVTLSVLDRGCASANIAIDSILVKEKPAGSVVSQDTTVCQRSTVNLSFNFVGLAPYKYKYTDGTTVSAEITTNNANETIAVAPAILPQTVFRLFSMSDLACAADVLTDSMVVDITPAPTATFIEINSKDTVCGKDTLTLKYTGTNFGSAAFDWHNFDSADVLSGSGEGPYDITFPTFGNKLIKLTVTENGCADSTTVPFFINDAPIATIDSNLSICSGGTARLKLTFSNGAPTYTYQVSGFAPSTTDSSVVHLDVSPTVTTTYKIISLVDKNTCQAVLGNDSAIVKVNESPVFDFDVKPKVCKDADGEVYISYTSGTSPWTASVFILNPKDTITQTSAANQDTVRFPVSQDIAVTVAVRDSNTCLSTSTKTLNIEIIPIPDAFFAPDEDSACTGAPVFVSNGLEYIPTYKYNLYSLGANILEAGSGNHIVSWATAGMKILEYSVFDGVCSSAKIIDSVFVNPSPEAAITTDKNVLCAEEEVNITVHLKGIKTFDFDLDIDGVVDHVTNHDDTVYVVSKQLLTSSDITISNLSDRICLNEVPESINLTVNPKPEINLNLDPAYCIDKTLVTIKDSVLTNIIYDHGSLPSNAFTDLGGGMLELYPDKAGVGSYNFVARSTNQFNCVDVETLALNVEEPKDPSFDVAPELCNNMDTVEVIFFSGAPFAGYTVDKSGLAYDPVTGFIFPSISQIGTYEVSHNNNFACNIAAATQTIKIIKGPDAPILANLKDTIVCRQTTLTNRYAIANAQPLVSYNWMFSRPSAGKITPVSAIKDTVDVVWTKGIRPADTLRIVAVSSACSSDSAVYPIYSDSVASQIYTVSDSTLDHNFIKLNYTSSASYPLYDTVAIERRPDVLSPWTPVSIANVLGDTIAYDEPTPTTSETAWYYRVGVKNYCGVTVYSDSARTILLSGLLVDESLGQVKIIFNDYEGWPVLGKNDKYEIWRKLGDQDTFEIFANYDKIVHDTGFVYTDIMQDDRNQCFRVKAIYDTLDASKAQVPSYSNIFCFKFINAPKIYNVFSPNGDGKNEYFYVDNIRSYPSNELYVLNRWGNKVYHKVDYNNDWDGDGLPAGTYFYLFKVKDPEENKTYEFKGNVLIVR